jgi:hypothetical protein
LALLRLFPFNNKVLADGAPVEMYVLYDDFVSKTPNADPRYCQLSPDNCAPVKKGDLVTVLDEKPILDKIHNTSFTKIKMGDGKTWYIYTPSLAKKEHFSNQKDSAKFWQTLPLPAYKELIGTTYSPKGSLPKELASGQFVTVGKDRNYSLSSVGNIYNKNYDYIFFEKINNPGTDKLSYTILDIVALDLTKFKKHATVWFQQCECKSKEDCSDVVAIYFHTDSVATKDVLVRPDKAWRPNYATMKLESIPAESVKCGSMAPEGDDAGGP